MTIRDKDKYRDAAWDWGIFKGCFGETRISPTDLDGIVERKGHFLILEAKGPSVPIPQGQMITFNRLCATGLFTIIVMWGEKDNPDLVQVMDFAGVSPPRKTDLQGVRDEVAGWFRHVDAMGEDE